MKRNFVASLLFAAAISTTAQAFDASGQGFDGNDDNGEERELKRDSQRNALTQQMNSDRGVSWYKDFFIAPFTYTEDYHGRESEVVFQISFKAKMFNTPLYFGYTQQSYWQAYNSNESAPFRESNYAPEFFWRFAPGEWWLDKVGLDLGVEHQSNGQSPEFSRSWNRFYAGLFHHDDRQSFYGRVFYRVPEDEKESPDDVKGDDNPDITDYLGYGELIWRYCLDKEACYNLITTKLRGNLNTGKGSVEVSWMFPTLSENTSWYVFVFNGYGESLIDYNDSTTRIGLGVILRPR